MLDNNILANHWLIQLVSPQMIERRAGSIIIISSIGGLHGSAVLGAYNISKAADFELARNLAVEFGPHNVRVNCLAPGLLEDSLHEMERHGVSRNIPWIISEYGYSAFAGRAEISIEGALMNADIVG